MSEPKARKEAWAEERLCDGWTSNLDPDHPAMVQAAAVEKRNAQLFEDARRKTEQAQTPPDAHGDKNPAPKS